MTFFKLWAIFGLLIFIPIQVAAILGLCLGIVVEEVSLGVGPVLVAKNGVSLKLLPIAAFVRFKHTDEINSPELGEVDTTGAFNHKPILIRLLMTICGPIALIFLAVPIFGTNAFVSFYSAFEQIFMGALHPLSTAQNSLLILKSLLYRESIYYVIAFLAPKFAALSLLPFWGLNGMAIVREFTPSSFKYLTMVQRITLFPLLALYLCWAFAAIVFLWP